MADFEEKKECDTKRYRKLDYTDIKRKIEKTSDQSGGSVECENFNQKFRNDSDPGKSTDDNDED